MDNQLPTSKPDQPNVILAAPFLDKFKGKGLILAGFFLVILIAAGAALVFYPAKSKPVEKRAVPKVETKQEKVATPSSRFSTFAFDKPIARVGEEVIYKKDLDTEILYYPKDAKIDKEKFLLDKIIQDSLILQGAKADGLISLDKSVFNSLDKDYMKRVKLAQQAKQAIDSRVDSISGSVISIWFFNTHPGSLGYEKGKEFAFKKISQVYDDVKDKKITFARAAEKIRNDGSLVQVDAAYQTNASFDFTGKHKNDAISIDKKLDVALWNLKEGEITDLFLSQDYDNTSKKKIDALYMFGTVTKKASNGKESSFQDWLDKKGKLYAVIYY